ncbi:MAG TPA: phosphatase PAP2 family protein [Polyangiaceae bacterium]|nr:phosphatase PAP2 family protein [Polyangiaceae bacterium]
MEPERPQAEEGAPPPVPTGEPAVREGRVARWAFRAYRALGPELTVACIALAVGALGLSAGLPLLLPDGPSLGFVERHYFRPLVVAFVAQVVLLAVRRDRSRSRVPMRDFAAALALVAVTIVVHFNLKAWMPLVHARLFDDELMRVDRVFGDLVPALTALRRVLASGLGRLHVPVDPLYHGVFVAAFFVSFTAHALFDTPNGFRRVVLAACLVLLIGGASYWILPAKGPFIYRPVESRLAELTQRAMEARFDAFVATRVPPPGYFTAPLAAMPSLHTAHATLFAIFAYRRLRWLFWPLALALFWIVIEAVAAGWHYVVDLPVGVGIAFGCIRLATLLIPEPSGP